MTNDPAIIYVMYVVRVVLWLRASLIYWGLGDGPRHPLQMGGLGYFLMLVRSLLANKCCRTWPPIWLSAHPSNQDKHIVLRICLDSTHIIQDALMGSEAIIHIPQCP